LNNLGHVEQARAEPGHPDFVVQGEKGCEHEQTIIRLRALAA
jgi:hypothetical protein